MILFNNLGLNLQCISEEMSILLGTLAILAIFLDAYAIKVRFLGIINIVFETMIIYSFMSKLVYCHGRMRPSSHNVSTILSFI